MRRCIPCDVLWRGLHDSACWACGGPGEPTWLGVVKDMAAPFESTDRAVRGDGIEPPTRAV